PTAFSELHALLSDHDYMLGKTRSPIAPYGPQAFYGARPSNNNISNNNNNHVNRNNSHGNNQGRDNGRQFDWASTQNTVYGTCNRCGIGHIPSQCPNRDPSTICTRPSANFANTHAQSSNTSANWHSDTGANSHETPDLEAMDNSEAYYGDDALHWQRRSCPHISEQNGLVERRNRHVMETGLTLLTQACVSQFSHLSPTSQTSPESSNGQPSPLSTTSIPPPPPPPITRQRPINLHQNPKQRVPYNPSTNHATLLPITITKPTSFTIANNSPEWRQAMKEEYDAVMQNGTWSLVPRASYTNVVNGIDFHKTFSPVVKSTTIRAILSLAVTNDWPLRQLDIQNVFLHGNLKEQAPHAWFECLSKALFDLSFKGSKTDPSLFIYSRGDTLLYILVYVDDIIVTGNKKGTIDNMICQLGSAFALKDLRPLNYFLGIEIVLHVFGILLSQMKYILELLQSVGLSNFNPVSSPMPDIAFAVNKVCQYMHAPTENHWSIVKRILRYLHGNPDTSFKAFSDADWARDSDDRWSTGGFAIYLGSNLISWTTHKQCTVSHSSTEAEYKALADTVAELTWLQALLNELRIRSSSTPILWCDNLGVAYLSANPIFHAHTKHVEIDYHFVREKVSQGDLQVQHISTHDQIADIFTKPLPTPRLLFLRSKMQVVVRP
ncbi:putative RNA-directed DNA polymerase, partial [Tanacetum coccineum]